MAMKWTLLMTSALLALASAQELTDWRLELLKESGLSAETEALEKFQKGLSQPDGNLDKMVKQLGSEEFKQREQAQKEILLLGKNVLPQLRLMLNSDDPEIRMRLETIMNQLEVGGRWAKDNLLREAVASLLEERKNPDAAKPNAKLFVEFFNKDAASVSDGYQRLKFKTGVGEAGSVKDGMARLNGKHDRDGDQQLLLLDSPTPSASSRRSAAAMKAWEPSMSGSQSEMSAPSSILDTRMEHFVSNKFLTTWRSWAIPT